MIAGAELNFLANKMLSFGDDDFALKSTGTTGSLSASVAFDIAVADDSTNAFTIKDSATTYLTIDTRPDEIIMIAGAELNFLDSVGVSFGTGEPDFEIKSSGTTGSLSASVAFDINLADDSVNAFAIKDSEGSYFTIDTRPDGNDIEVHGKLNVEDGIEITTKTSVTKASQGTSGSLPVTQNLRAGSITIDMGHTWANDSGFDVEFHNTEIDVDSVVVVSTSANAEFSVTRVANNSCFFTGFQETGAGISSDFNINYVVL